MYETVMMVLQGALAELRTLIDPTLYWEYVLFNSNGKSILYTKLQKYLYEYIRSELLFYKNFPIDLQEMGIVTNPYDPCVMKNMVDGRQSTIVWHVDDPKLSYVDEG